MLNLKEMIKKWIRTSEILKHDRAMNEDTVLIHVDFQNRIITSRESFKAMYCAKWSVQEKTVECIDKFKKAIGGNI